jgi:hypothetical protein
MSIAKLSTPEGPEDSAVQNRLTAAGLVLTTLFFAGSFALALNAQSEGRRPFAAAFGYLEVALAVGALLAIAAIAALLACQQCAGSDSAWFRSKRAWFTVATVALYLALSQAMSAGLTELVFGIKETFNADLLAKALASAASVLWIVLLFVAPIHAIRSWWKHFGRGEQLFVALTYAVSLVFLLTTNAAIYMVQDKAPETFHVFLENLIRQLLQPMMWPEPWTPRPAG